jgi:hypothetical protein
MVAAVGLQRDFDGPALRRLARRSKDSGQARRWQRFVTRAAAARRRGSAGLRCNAFGIGSAVQ